MHIEKLKGIYLRENVACVKRDRGGVGVGGGGGGGLKRELKREADKGDNEGRETQIGQNNILVGHFA